MTTKRVPLCATISSKTRSRFATKPFSGAALRSRITLCSRTTLIAAALLSYACSSSVGGENNGDGSGGGGEVTTTGGNTAAGGDVGTATGGSVGSGGVVTGSGGAPASGGAPGTGGTDIVGTGGEAPSTGGVDAGAGGDVGTGGESSDECVVGQTQGNQVVVIGESFIAATRDITRRIEELARENGSLGQDDNYIDNSVSGTTLINNQIPGQYDSAAQSNDIKYVLMDGGGNDCWIHDDDTGALNAAADLFENMAQDGVEKVVYFFYPDPVGGQYASLTACLDRLRPEMQALCEGLESPKCYWLDQREIWDGHPEYTGDGIHPTQAGSYASAEGIWEVMQENCVAQ